MIRETVLDGEPALAVDTEEKFARALGSGVYVVPPTMADALAGGLTSEAARWLWATFLAVVSSGWASVASWWNS